MHVEIPLQAYFRINTENMGQFERTLIIVDEDAYVHYVEGCTAPIYSSDSLHSAVVEIIVKKGARCRYTTIQNWSNNVYNLVTKRAVAQAGATMEWVDGNIGSKVTMKYPAVYLMGEHARGETLSVAFAGRASTRTPAPRWCTAPPTPPRRSSPSRWPGRAAARPTAAWSRCTRAHLTPSRRSSATRCWSTPSAAPTPTPTSMSARTTWRWGTRRRSRRSADDQLFYLMSRGMTEDEAMATIVRGFVEPIARELPMEYALELNRLIELQMEGAVG